VCSSDLMFYDARGQEQLNAAYMVANALGSAIDKDIEMLEALFENPVLKEAVSERNARYKGVGEAEMKLKFEEADKAWAAADEKDPLIQEYLNNPAGIVLNEWVRGLSYASEIFVTDKYGGLVAASGKTTDFYQADEGWWQGAFDNGKGRIFIEGVLLDESSGVLGISAGFPVRGSGGELIGIGKAVIDLNNYYKMLMNSKCGAAGHIAVVDKKGYILFHRDTAPLSAKAMSERDFRALLLSSQKWKIIERSNLHRGKVLFAFQPVRSPYLMQSGVVWIVLAEQTVEEVFAPLKALHPQLFILALLLSLVTVITGFYFGNKLASPIYRLRELLDRMATGAPEAAADPGVENEIGELGDSIDEIAAALQSSRAEAERHLREMESAEARLGVLKNAVNEARDEADAFRAELEKKVSERTEYLTETQKAVINIMEDLQVSKEEVERTNIQISNAYEELKDTQRKLVQSEKMAALGRFSSGIAHEVKNPLGIILGGMEYIEAKMTNVELSVRVAIEKVKEAVLRADKVLQGLLRFARPSKLVMEQVKPVDLVQEVIALFKYKTSLININITTEFSEEDMHVSVDKNQIQQVLFNLLMNSIEALPNGGSIRVRAYRTMFPGAAGETRVGCAIEVIDNGEGISKENISNLFEPFFTTKRDRAGTGLGLAIAKSIIDNHKGTMTIESEQGKGTAVKIILPLVPRAIE
jgi:signal transduction histidine kinase